MNIIMLARFYSPHKGGVERHVEELSKILLKRGHKITIITEQFSNDLKLEEELGGVKIFRIPFFAIGSKRLVWTWMEKHNYLIEDADLVHTHDVYWWYWPTRVLQLIKPVYITFHGYEGNKLPRWQAVVQRKLAELASFGSICVGDFMKRWYFAHPSLVTYGSTNIKDRKAGAVTKSAVFWGRFDLDTGIDVYLEGFSVAKNLDYLEVYGNGQLIDLVNQTSRKDQRVHIYEWEKDVTKIVKQHKYAFVSRYLSILEAMRLRCLVVAVFNNKIKKDYLECHPMRDNMIIAGSAEELAYKVAELENDPKRSERMIERAYAWAKEQTWSKMADTYEALWRK